MTEPVSRSVGNSLPRSVRVLGWASLLNDVASEAIYPLLPGFLISLGGGPTFLGFVEGLADTVASLLKVWTGMLSDRLGRRKTFILLGYGLTVFSRPVMGLTSHVLQLLGIRLLDRIGKGLRTAPRDAMIAESVPESQRGRAFGFHRAMDHLGAAIGPLLASLLLWLMAERFADNSVRLLMLLTLIPGCLAFSLQLWGLKDAPAQRAETEHTVSAVPSGAFRFYLFSLLVFSLANSSDAFLLLRAGELGIPTLWLPLLWSALHLAKSAGNRLGGLASDRWSPQKLVLAGWFLYAALYAGFGLAETRWQILALFAAYAGYFALTEPAEKKLVAEFAGVGESGTAFGWFHTALGLTNLPSSLIFGWIYQSFGPAVAFSWGALSAFVAAGLLMLVRPTKGNGRHASEVR